MAIFMNKFRPVLAAMVLVVCIVANVVACADSNLSLRLKNDKLTSEDAHKLLQAVEDKELVSVGEYTVAEALALGNFSLDQCTPEVFANRLSARIKYSHFGEQRQYAGLHNYVTNCVRQLANYCVDNMEQVAHELMATLVTPADVANLNNFISKLGHYKKASGVVDLLAVEQADADYQDSHSGLFGGQVPEEAKMALWWGLKSSCLAVMGVADFKQSLQKWSSHQGQQVDNVLAASWPGVQQACAIYVNELFPKAEAEFRHYKRAECAKLV